MSIEKINKSKQDYATTPPTGDKVSGVPSKGYILGANEITVMVCTFILLCLAFAPWITYSTNFEGPFFNGSGESSKATSFYYMMSLCEEYLTFILFVALLVGNIVAKFFNRTSWLTAITIAVYSHMLLITIDVAEDVFNSFGFIKFQVEYSPWAWLAWLVIAFLAMNALVSHANWLITLDKRGAKRLATISASILGFCICIGMAVELMDVSSNNEGLFAKFITAILEPINKMGGSLFLKSAFLIIGWLGPIVSLIALLEGGIVWLAKRNQTDGDEPSTSGYTRVGDDTANTNDDSFAKLKDFKPTRQQMMIGGGTLAAVAVVFAVWMLFKVIGNPFSSIPEPEFYQVVGKVENTGEGQFYQYADENAPLVMALDGFPSTLHDGYAFKCDTVSANEWTMVFADLFYIGFVKTEAVTIDTDINGGIPDEQRVWHQQYFPGSSGCGGGDMYTWRYSGKRNLAVRFEDWWSCEMDEDSGSMTLYLGQYQDGLFVFSYKMDIDNVNYRDNFHGFGSEPGDSIGHYNLVYGDDVAIPINGDVDPDIDWAKISEDDLLKSFAPLIKAHEREPYIINWDDMSTCLVEDDAYSTNGSFSEIEESEVEIETPRFVMPAFNGNFASFALNVERNLGSEPKIAPAFMETPIYMNGKVTDSNNMLTYEASDGIRWQLFFDGSPHYSEARLTGVALSTSRISDTPLDACRALNMAMVNNGYQGVATGLRRSPSGNYMSAGHVGNRIVCYIYTPIAPSMDPAPTR